LDVERAEREAAKLEEKINFDRHNQYFDQCLHVASSNGLDPELVKLANNQVHRALQSGINVHATFVSPRAPSTAHMTPRHAASVPVQAFAPELLMSPGNPAWGKLQFLQENFSQIPAVQVQVQVGECHPSGKFSARFLQIPANSCRLSALIPALLQEFLQGCRSESVM
jgi:hypothetical protein